MPVIDFTFTCAVPGDQLAANVKHNHARGLAALGHAWPVKPSLAIVGGSPDVLGRIDELMRFDGEIWAINGAYEALRNHGVDCAFFTIDPHPVVESLARGAKRAILASVVDPSVIDSLADGAQVEIFDIGLNDILHGSTTATCGAHLAVERGHTTVTFYGCGSNYGQQSHAYKDTKSNGARIYINTCRGEYVTEPAYYEQAKYIAACIRAAPAVFKERSGGLLGALVEDENHDIVAADRWLHEKLNEKQTQPQAAVS